MDSSSETKVFHLNCGTMQPLGGRLLNRSPALITCHCLLVETRGELLLVDAGVGLADMESSSPTWTWTTREGSPTSRMPRSMCSGRSSRPPRNPPHAWSATDTASVISRILRNG